MRGIAPVMAGVAMAAHRNRWGYSPIFWLIGVDGFHLHIFMLEAAFPHPNMDVHISFLIAQQSIAILHI
jgi:hypothetical protein